MLPQLSKEELLEEWNQKHVLFDIDPEKRNRVRGILEEIRKNGWTAVREYSLEFDDTEASKEPISQNVINDAWDDLEPKQKEALKTIRNRVRRYQESIRPSSSVISDAGEGLLGHLTRPVQTVGCYVPGGRVPLPSTVLMNAYIAELAGVEEVVICSPPGSKEGRPHEYILAAASLLNRPTLYAVGGVQAIGSMTFGAGPVPPADLITGPGNIYVTLAKKEVFGEVDIDMLAGPSEIAVVADPESTESEYVAWDLLSQAEHDPLSRVILLTTSETFLEQINEKMKKYVDDHPSGDTVLKSIQNSASTLIESVSEGVHICNTIAPEHLELHVDNPEKWSRDCKNAGAIFLGANNPEPVGDYVAGPSHTLPTGGSARFFSPLSIRTFYKSQSVISLNEETLSSVRGIAERVASMESLYAHQKSLTVRD